MSSTSRCASAAILGLLLSCSLSGVASGQEVRQNPFLPQATSEEERVMAERERMRQAIREMMPEIRAMVMPSLEEQRETLRNEILAEVSANPGVVAAGATATIDPTTGAPVAAATAADPGAPPEGARFLACINGKALYRDANDIRYFDESEAAAERCSS